MNLLFDACISPRLVRLLADLFPDAVHVFECGEIHDDDTLIWRYARDNGFTIVTKDGDFQSRSLVLGWPPKIIWLRVGNAGTRAVAQVLRTNLTEIASFARDVDAALLILDP